MVIIIYSAETGKSIPVNLGRPDYSYYFVSQAFRAVLRKLAYVIETSDPENEVDLIYEECRSMGEACVFLSFSPPHGTVTGLRCPTISVFAWEFTTIPTDPFEGDYRYDWRNVFREHACAITHSSAAVRAVHEAMGSEFPVWCIPAPVWDDYVKLGTRNRPAAHSTGVDLSFEGHLIDFTGCGASSVPLEQRNGFLEERTFPKKDEAVRIHLDGIIYTTVFNPSDGRKNWQDLISAFVWALRESPDATLVLKVSHYDFEEARKLVTDEVFKLVPFECRVVVLHGYLNGREYAKLIRQSTFVVNVSYGEGQCLPLMEAMSAGKPAISPVHTAMEDYVAQSNCFVIRSSAERAWWPHDPRRAFRTTRYRIDWESLRSAYLESFHVAKHDSVRYARMASSAVESLRGFCSKAVAEERLRSLFRECGIANDDPRTARRNLWRAATRALVRVWRLVVVPKIRSLRTDRRTKIAQLQADADAS